LDLRRAFGTRILSCNAKNLRVGEKVREAKKKGCNYIALNGMPVTNFPFLWERSPQKLIAEAHNADIGVIYPFYFDKISENNPDFPHLEALDKDLFLRREDGELISCIKATGAGLDREEERLFTGAAAIENYNTEALRYLMQEWNPDGVSLAAGCLGESGNAQRARHMLSGGKSRYSVTEITLQAQDNSLHNYCEDLPFVDGLLFADAGNLPALRRLWEYSGVPYGLGGEAQTGLDPVLGLLFCLKLRFGVQDEDGERTNKSLAGIGRRFGLRDAVLRGFWDERNPLTADNENILITVYQKGENLLAAVYNDGGKTERFRLIPKEESGFSFAGKRVRRPLLFGVHGAGRPDLKKTISLRAQSGFLLCIEKEEKK
jgi:hypothetical protein